ncbi:MAG: TfoX/Sxy family protein [Candidatus Paceibacteria bacterium]
MSTQKETVEFILEKLGEPEVFSVRKMFGEYALYVHPAGGEAGPKVVGLICDDQLYVKIVPASRELEGVCEKDEAYPGSKPYYLVEESELSHIKNLAEILCNVAESLPPPKPKKKKDKVTVSAIKKKVKK